MKRHEHYSVGIYCRLSKDDIARDENGSSSIVSQKSQLERFVHDSGWSIYRCYIDDGKKIVSQFCGW